jgi:hypothetical protein
VRVFIPNPGDDFLSWANNLSNEFLNYTVPVATDSNLWREWAVSFLLSNPSLSNFPLPSENLADWKKWAELFTNNLYTSQ